jgi:major intracellular serine protease
MQKFIVTANKLNRRKVVPAMLPDPNNIIDVVMKGFIFEAIEANDQEMPPTVHDKWFKDSNGFFYWGGGINELRTIPTTGFESTALVVQSFQWFKDLRIEEIWNQFNERGDNVTIAILDTGYDRSNSELPVPLLSKLFVNNSSNTATIDDKIGHGTFCMSLVAARNKSVNIGVTPLCKTLIGKVSLRGELRDVNFILDGIEWAIQSGADIISISLGVPLDDQQQINQLQTRFNNITTDKNVLIFAACGDSDSGQIISKEFYPSSLDNCISIGTVKNDLIDNITVRSNKTILHTLGVDIEGYMLNSAIEKQSGTSMSTPIVAGVMALAVSFIKKRNNGQWNKNELLQRLIQTARSVSGSPGKKIINPLAFFQSL